MNGFARLALGVVSLAGFAFMVRGDAAAQNIQPAPRQGTESSLQLTLPEMESFLVQAPNAHPGSSLKGLQDFNAPVIWRKHDWPGFYDRFHLPGGYQASDSVVSNLSDGQIFVQTFDFGDGNRRFGRFDLRNGDGGQALVIMDGSVYGSMTEDGGGGVQWFVGQGCGASPTAGLRGWLFFDSIVSRESWRSRVAKLNIEKTLSSCPWFYNDAFTRWKRVAAHFPYRIVKPGAEPYSGTFKVDAILSEHYGGSSIASASHLERFWFGRGYGLLRWERWENMAETSRPNVRADAEMLAKSGRCGLVEGSVAPGPEWKMVDCRTWTNFVESSKPWKAAEFNWPRPNVIAQFERAFEKP